jgi:ABC-type branched-subunit amino acid transport system permease subunit
MSSLSESIRDYLATHASLTAAEAQRLWGLSRSRAGNLLRAQRDAGVIAPIPGRYPRHYRIARLEVEANG